MEAVDYVDFRQWLLTAAPQLVPGLFERHCVRAGIAGFQPRERAEQAACNADIGRFDSNVVVEVRAPAVAALALSVGQPPDGQQIGRIEQTDAVDQVEPDASFKLVCDIQQAGGNQAGLHPIIQFAVQEMPKI